MAEDPEPDSKGAAAVVAATVVVEAEPAADDRGECEGDLAEPP